MSNCPAASSDATYRIADYCFRVRCHDKTLIEDAVSLFQKSSDQSLDYEVIDLDSPNHFIGEEEKTDRPEIAVKRIISSAQANYEGKLFCFDACCLITPQGKTVLLLGLSWAGKSTTGVALALGLGWKILSEDVVFVDPVNNRVLSFVCPISLRSGAREMISRVVDSKLIGTFYDRWFVDYDIFHQHDIPASFDLCLILDSSNRGADLSISHLTPGEFAKKLITFGDWLLMPGGPEFVWNFLHEQCWVLKNGTLQQRYVWLRDALEALADDSAGAPALSKPG